MARFVLWPLFQCCFCVLALPADEFDAATATTAAEQALAAAERQFGRDAEETIAAAGNLGRTLHLQGRFLEAEPLYERVLRFFERSTGPNATETATALTNLAAVQGDLGRYERAQQLHERAFAIYERNLGPDHTSTATSLANLASLHILAGRYAQAEEGFERALRVFEKSLGSDHPNVAGTLGEIAALHIGQGQFDKAETLYRRAIAANELGRGREHPDTASSLQGLAQLLLKLGRVGEAEPLAARALIIRERALGPQHPLVGQSLDTAAQICVRKRDLARAETLLERALATAEHALGPDHPNTATSLSNLAVVLNSAGAHDRADPLTRRALALKERALGPDHPDTVQCLMNFAIARAARGGFAESATLLDRARRGARRYVAGVLPALSAEDQWAFLAMRDQEHLHMALLMGLTYRQHAGYAEFSAAWLANGKALAQEAAGQRGILARQLTDPGTTEAVRRLQAVRSELATLSQRPTDHGWTRTHRARFVELQAEERTLIRGIGGRLAAVSRPDPWVELDAIRRSIPEGSLLVDIARITARDPPQPGQEGSRWYPPIYAAWVVPPAGRGDVTMIDIGGSEKIDAAVAACRRLIEAAQKGGFPRGQHAAEEELKAAAAPLTARILEPIRAAVAASGRPIDEIIISPDGPLWLVPWAALPFADGSYAIERFAIRTVTSGRDLVPPPTQPQNTVNGSLVVADPAFGPAPASGGGLPFPPLPATRSEALATQAAIATLTGDEPKILLGPDASESNFTRFAVRPRILVLATHGFFKPDQEVKRDAPFDHPEPAAGGRAIGRVVAASGEPIEDPLLRCGLALARANAGPQATGGGDGIVTGAEIVGLDLLGTDLVVLSACETGLGTLKNGEGVAGLRQAFQIAGAQRVVATLWQVPDRESAQIMSGFYANLPRGKTASQALREAQLVFIKQRREDRAAGEAAHPYLWAAYGVTGR